MIAVVDTGPLYSVADRSDIDHARSLAVLQRADLELVIAGLAVAETCYLIGERLGPRAEASFLQSLSGFDVRQPHVDDWARVGELVLEYADFPLGGVDASVAALAERLDTDLIVTLDQRHFRALRPRHCPAFHLLPE